MRPVSAVVKPALAEVSAGSPAVTWPSANDRGDTVTGTSVPSVPAGADNSAVAGSVTEAITVPSRMPGPATAWLTSAALKPAVSA
jgi:hypothetical protein